MMEASDSDDPVSASVASVGHSRSQSLRDVLSNLNPMHRHDTSPHKSDDKATATRRASHTSFELDVSLISSDDQDGDDMISLDSGDIDALDSLDIGRISTGGRSDRSVHSLDVSGSTNHLHGRQIGGDSSVDEGVLVRVCGSGNELIDGRHTVDGMDPLFIPTSDTECATAQAAEVDDVAGNGFASVTTYAQASYDSAKKNEDNTTDIIDVLGTSLDNAMIPTMSYGATNGADSDSVSEPFAIDSCHGDESSDTGEVAVSHGERLSLYGDNTTDDVATLQINATSNDELSSGFILAVHSPARSQTSLASQANTSFYTHTRARTQTHIKAPSARNSTTHSRNKSGTFGAGSGRVSYGDDFDFGSVNGLEGIHTGTTASSTNSYDNRSRSSEPNRRGSTITEYSFVGRFDSLASAVSVTLDSNGPMAQIAPRPNMEMPEISLSSSPSPDLEPPHKYLQHTRSKSLLPPAARDMADFSRNHGNDQDAPADQSGDSSPGARRLAPPPPTEDRPYSERLIDVSDPIAMGNYMNKHTVYAVIWHEGTQQQNKRRAGAGVSVRRRYQHFAWLRDSLIADHPHVLVPPLPSQNALCLPNAHLYTDAHEHARAHAAKRALGMDGDIIFGPETYTNESDNGTGPPVNDLRLCGLSHFLNSVAAHPVLNPPPAQSVQGRGLTPPMGGLHGLSERCSNRHLRMFMNASTNANTDMAVDNAATATFKGLVSRNKPALSANAPKLPYNRTDVDQYAKIILQLLGSVQAQCRAEAQLCGDQGPLDQFSDVLRKYSPSATSTSSGGDVPAERYDSSKADLAHTPSMHPVALSLQMSMRSKSSASFEAMRRLSSVAVNGPMKQSGTNTGTSVIRDTAGSVAITDDTPWSPSLFAHTPHLSPLENGQDRAEKPAPIDSHSLRTAHTRTASDYSRTAYTFTNAMDTEGSDDEYPPEPHHEQPSTSHYQQDTTVPGESSDTKSGLLRVVTHGSHGLALSPPLHHSPLHSPRHTPPHSRPHTPPGSPPATKEQPMRFARSPVYHFSHTHTPPVSPHTAPYPALADDSISEPLPISLRDVMATSEMMLRLHVQIRNRDHIGGAMLNLALQLQTQHTTAVAVGELMESRDDEQRRCEKLTDDMNVIRAYITLATSSEKRRSLELQLLQSEREVANARENLEKMNKSVAQEMRNWGLRDVERALKADMHKHAIANVSSLKQANAQCESLLETLEALG